MILRKHIAFVLVCLCLLLSGQAQAAESAKKFAVLPFTVNGPDKFSYLSKAVQDMFSSRLAWEGRLIGIPSEQINKATGGKPVSEDGMPGLFGALGVDYLVFGSLTIVGDECSVDARVKSKDGKVWPKATKTKLDKLISSMETLSNSINAEVFKRNETVTSSGGQSSQQKQAINAMNPDFVHNQTSENQEFFLNPQFRYAGDAGESGRIRSQSLPYVGRSMAVGDLDGDGKNEVVVGADHAVYAYRFDEKNQLQPLAHHEFGNLMQVVRVSLIDLGREGRQKIIVSIADTDSAPKTAILSLTGAKFNIEADGIAWYLNVINVPPDYRPVLIGQQHGADSLFAGAIQEMSKGGKGVIPGGSLLTPKDANVFNFSYLPVPGEDYKIVLVDQKDYIRVFTKSGDRQYTSEKVYSGSSLGLDDNSTTGGMRDSVVTKPMIYIPLRMIPYKLPADKNYNLLVNHPISVAAQFFTRYRFYPEGEVHSLSWDGVGMALVWKTRRIKGSVCDYNLADINNDGNMKLNVLINTHPGALGAKSRRTAILSYPLDTSKGPGNVGQEFRNED